MDEKIKFKYFKVPKIDMNFENLSDGENKISLSSSINIMVPKNEDELESIVEISISFKNDKKDIILEVSMRGYFEIINDSTTIDLDNEEKHDLLKTHAVPSLYKDLRKYIDNLFEKSNIEFMNIPSLEDINL